ncbi:hypothetical protein PHLCEN_2v3908 [Hermanssonia centrifuga]|uniref:RTA1-like protein n=1 Tax=Hermanssonia centrifuga TaxID=98765 RepID=A0A2R6QBB3_9APHY|nr:hypothetical protein PHLCEN_2v3908 [Hermanssonia centrifuga]
MTGRNSLGRLFSLQALFLLVLATSTAYAGSHNGIAPPADPFASPQTDPYNPLKYITTNSLTAVGLALVVAIAIPHTWMTWKYKAKFMLAMVIAEYTYAVGIATRFGLHYNPESNGLYIVEYLFVTLSPCGFIAAEYVMLGRMARWLKADQHMLIPPQKITLVFVLSDVTTFLVQAAGGCTSASARTNPALAVTGSRIFLAGLAMQLVSFVLFLALYIRFLWRMHKYEPETWKKDEGLPWYKDWRSLAVAMFISCIGILVRSVYRTVELSEGYQGHLTTTESFFYLLDLLPLLIALVVYIPFWPGRFIPSTAPGAFEESVPQEKSEEGTLTEDNVHRKSKSSA